MDELLLQHRKKREAVLWGLLALAYLGWTLLFQEIYWSSQSKLPRDNWEHHFPLFGYVVEYLREFGSVPSWFYSMHGGIWIEPLVNNYLLLAPHRLFGYALGVLGVHPLVAYKISLFWFGHGLFFLGIALVLRHLFGFRIAILGTALGLMSGAGITYIHQEHALGTAFFIPWIAYCALRLKEGKRWLYLGAALLGLALNTHYPQLLFAYGLAAAIGISIQQGWKHFAKLRGATLPLCLLILLVGASPLFYTYFGFKDQLKSPYRGQEGVAAKTYDDYLKINLPSTSLHPHNLAQYIRQDRSRRKNLATFDETPLFIGAALLFSLFIAFFRPIPWKRFQWTTTVLLAWFATGYYWGASATLWNVLPGITMFRQWYHFLPILNLHLLLLMMSALHRVWLDLENSEGRRIYSAGAFVFFGLSLIGYWEIALIPALFSAVVAWRPSFQRPMVAFGIAWMLLSSLSWSVKTTKDYERGLVQHRPSKSQDLLSRLQSHFPRRRANALPKGSFDLYPMNLPSPYGWKIGQGFRPAHPSEIRSKAESGALKIELLNPPRDATQVYVLQFNDGRWMESRLGTGERSAKKGPMNVLSFSLQPEEITLQRPTSRWPALALFSFLPTLLLIGGPLAVRLRRRYRQDKQISLGEPA